MWLTKDTIDGPNSRVALMLAYVTYYHQERIDRSVAANETKARWIRAAVITGFLAPIALFGGLLVPDGYLKALF